MTERVTASNRRSSQRFPYLTQVLFRADGTTFVRATTCDFSPQGARLRVPDLPSVGTRVALNLPVREPHLSSPRLLSVQATVQWTRRGAKGPEIGVAFQGGCPADMGRLQAWLHSRQIQHSRIGA